MVRRWIFRRGAAAMAWSAACGASTGIGLRPAGTASSLASATSSAGMRPASRDAVEHAVARSARGRDRAVRPAQLRRLRQRDQQRRLGHRQPARLLAEIGERRRANAFEIAAIGREAEIERQHLVLGERALELDRAHHLPQLGGERALGARLQQPRHLHGDGRAAGHDAAAGDELKRGARHRQRIDAGMRAEAPVLVGQQHVDIARIDVARAWPAAASGPPASRRAAAGGPRGRPPASNNPAPRRAARARANGPTTRRRAPRRQPRRRRSMQNEAPDPHRVLTSPHDLDRAGAGAAEAVGTVHVLDIGLRQHVAARRHRAHHVGDREHRLVALVALERRAEPVVAELRVHRRRGVLDPRQRAGVARRHQPRIVDLEAGRQIVGDDDAAELRLRPR